VDLAKVVQVTQATANVVQALALVIGGCWVYFKFIRGRTFARRAELSVEAALASVGERQMICVKVVLTNTGLSRIPLRPHSQVVTLSVTPAADFRPGRNFVWQHWMITEVFTAHKFVEAQEAISDEALLPVAPEGGLWMAYRVEAQAWTEPHWAQTGGMRWVTGVDVPAQLDQPVPAAE
jgi:hypothetical protein